MQKRFSFFQKSGVYIVALLPFALLSALVLCAALPVSCRLTENGISIINTDLTAPEVLSFSVTGESSLSLSFSEPVLIPDAAVEPALGCTFSYSEDGLAASVLLSEATEIGESYEFFCTVQDASGNTLTYSRPFTGYNAHPAALLLSEVRFGHSAASAKSRKAEYVELYVQSGGNTAGLLLCAGYYSASYAFPVMEVSAGEYITVHLRTYYDDCADETGTNTALSCSSPDASSGRDLWISGDNAFMTKTDVLVVQNTADGALLDALLVRENETKIAWTRTNQKTLATLAYESGLWLGGDTPEAAATGTSGVSKSLSRTSFSASAATAGDWHIAACTPGSAND